MSLSRRTVRFTLSPALAAGQEWAVGAFPAVIQRATGYSERWTLMEQSVDAADGAPAWRYEVQGLPEIDLVVDHIIHELTDAVLMSEEHTVTLDAFTFGSTRRDRPEKTQPQSLHENPPPPSPSPSRGEGWVGVKRYLCVLAVLMMLALGMPAWAQEPARPAQPQAVEAALTAVARHLSPPYALYLYESLTAQVLFNENIAERPNSPSAPLANDSLWALAIMSKSILVDGPDGQYLDIRRVPPFFEDVARRYTNPSHYWPDREITKETRREQLAAWYALYLMLLVGNATQDEIARKLKNGAFERDPGALTPGGPSLVDRLKQEGGLDANAYPLAHIKRTGPADTESLTFPAYMDSWKARIHAAYGVSPPP